MVYINSPKRRLQAHLSASHSFNKLYNDTVPDTMTLTIVVWPESSAQSLTKPWRACREKTKKKINGKQGRFQEISGPVWALPSFFTVKRVTPKGQKKKKKNTEGTFFFSLMLQQLLSYSYISGRPRSSHL